MMNINPNIGKPAEPATLVNVQILKSAKNYFINIL